MGRCRHFQSRNMATRSTYDPGIILSVLLLPKELSWFGPQFNLWFVYIPMRYLPGQSLAMFEKTLTIATLFRRYDLSLKPGFRMQYLPSSTLRPEKGLMIYAARGHS